MTNEPKNIRDEIAKALLEDLLKRCAPEMRFKRWDDLGEDGLEFWRGKADTFIASVKP